MAAGIRAVKPGILPHERVVRRWGYGGGFDRRLRGQDAPLYVRQGCLTLRDGGSAGIPLGIEAVPDKYRLRVTLRSDDMCAPGKRAADDWLTAGRFAALLGLLIGASFPQVVAGLEAFVRLDSVRFAYPVAFHYREAFWVGEVPLWNPYNSCGLPFLAQWNTMTLYPLSLFYLILPMPWSFGVFNLGHLFLAGAGMYFLAYRWAGSRVGAAVAGAVFAFNGLTWQGLMWPNLIAAWGWMPWVVLAVERGWREGGRWFVVAALTGAVQMLSGGAEVILFTWVVIGGLWLALLFKAEVPPLKLIGRALAIVCLVAGLAAAQMLPFLDLLVHSQRTVNYGDSADVVMPAWGWANYLVPLFHGFRTAQGIFVQPTQNWTASYYLGVGILGLALLAVWRVRNYRIWLLLALTLFSLTMALGSRGYVYDVMHRLVPPLGLLRFPIKFVMLATFAIPLLAAYGFRVAAVHPGRPMGAGMEKNCRARAGLAGLDRRHSLLRLEAPASGGSTAADHHEWPRPDAVPGACLWGYHTPFANRRPEAASAAPSGPDSAALVRCLYPHPELKSHRLQLGV